MLLSSTSDSHPTHQNVCRVIFGSITTAEDGRNTDWLPQRKPWWCHCPNTIAMILLAVTTHTSCMCGVALRKLPWKDILSPLLWEAPAITVRLWRVTSLKIAEVSVIQMPMMDAILWHPSPISLHGIHLTLTNYPFRWYSVVYYAISSPFWCQIKAKMTLFWPPSDYC